MPTRSRRSAVRALALSRAVSSPATTTRPSSGRSSVAATASRLDFPEPEGPTTAVSSPADTWRDTESRAVSRRSPSG